MLTLVKYLINIKIKRFVSPRKFTTLLIKPFGTDLQEKKKKLINMSIKKEKIMVKFHKGTYHFQIPEFLIDTPKNLQEKQTKEMLKFFS